MDARAKLETYQRRFDALLRLCERYHAAACDAFEEMMRLPLSSAPEFQKAADEWTRAKADGITAHRYLKLARARNEEAYKALYPDKAA
jgi:hypothetical protein